MTTATPPVGSFWRQVRIQRTVKNAVVYTLLVVIAVAMTSPFIWTVSTALKARGAEFTYPPKLIPQPVMWSNFADAMTALPFHLFFRNTLTITAINVIGTLIVASMAAYAFARIDFAGRRFWFAVVLSTMMLPSVITMVPNYIIMVKIGWVDTFLPLTVPAVLGGGAFWIFVLRQFFSTIPREMDEAARIDGAGHLRILVQIILPLSKPALASVAVLNFIGHWNEFFYANIYLDTLEKKTLSIGLRLFQTQYETRWNLMMAASVVVLIPVLIVFFMAQKYFVQGINVSGLSGR